MKLKERPEDFQVEEVSRPPPADPGGAYQLFRLEKRGVEAFDAIEAIARALGVERRDVAMAGLKDQRSESTQLVSVYAPGRRFEGALSGEGSGGGGLLPGRSLTAGRGLSLVLLGRAARAVRGDDIERNRFTLVVRDLGPGAVEQAAARLPALRRDGLPGYFDDQRFGGASPERGFVAEAWSRGDLKGALELLIARPSPKDPRQERLEKEAVRARWGDWAGLSKLVRGDSAPVVRALARAPDDLAGAFRALDARFRALLLAQYQSLLWNREAEAAVRAALPRKALFDTMYRCGTFALFRAAAGLSHPEALAALRAREIPFAPIPVPPEIGVEAKGGARALVLNVESIDLSDERDDELRPGRRRALLRLEIPRSAYATLVAKRLFYEPGDRPATSATNDAPAASV